MSTQEITARQALGLGGTGGGSSNPNGQANMANSSPVVIASDQTAIPISGTVGVSGTVPVSVSSTIPVSIAATVPVSGTFFLSTQPVSIASMPSTPVTGTFFQSTQPVSIATMPSTPVTGTFWQATQPVSAAALPLPTGAATEATLATMSAKFPVLGQATGANSQPVVLASDQVLVGNPNQLTPSLPVKISPYTKFRTTFAAVIANGVDTTYWTLVKTGSGQTVNQASGNLVLTTGTTANSETIIRSLITFQDAFKLKMGVIASQRIINQNLIIELVDLIGTALAYTINSTTSVTVTFTGSNPFTSQNVGQSITIGNLSSVGVPMQAVIASFSGLTVTLTVAGFPASGSGTCDLFGLNYFQTIYTGTTATTASFDTQRGGWHAGSNNAVISTTASPGSYNIVTNDDAGASFFSHNTITQNFTGNNYPATESVTKWQNIPDASTPLYLQIRNLNGTTNPASTTTWTLPFIGLESIIVQPVNLSSTSVQTTSSPLPVQVFNPPSTTLGVAPGGTSAAAAEGITNPTAYQIRTYPSYYNGTTMDRIHGNWNTTTGDTGAKIANGNGATQTNFDSRGATITVLLGTVTGTFTTFQTQLQWSPDAGTTWLNYGVAQTNLTTPVSGNTFTFQVYPTTQTSSTPGSTQSVLINNVLPRTWRITWTIAGTSPSATITGVYVNYQL